VTWDRCKNGIQNLRPPASYMMGNNPNYKQVARFVSTRGRTSDLSASASLAASVSLAQPEGVDPASVSLAQPGGVDLPVLPDLPALACVASPGQPAENVASPQQAAGNVEGDLAVVSAETSIAGSP